MDAVEAGVDNKLNTSTLEEISHRDVALLRRVEDLLRKLCQRDAALSRESSPAA
jgi:hypothetical protein